jgi:hypothetical protein
VLRRAATHPSCPPEAADQVLTWLALGGTGDADSEFDPVECVGHPGDGDISASAWYTRQAAATPNRSRLRVTHPLWRVRAAAVRPGAAAIRGRPLAMLTRDPRPEARRAVASSGRVSYQVLWELRLDADPAVAKAAARRVGRKGANSGDLALAALAYNIVELASSIKLWGTLLAVTCVVGGTIGALTKPGGLAGARGGERAAVTQQLPGDGLLSCRPDPADHSKSFVFIMAGSENITVRFPGRRFPGDDTATADQPLAPPPTTAVVAPGKSVAYLLPSGPVPVQVMATPASGAPEAPLTMDACG